MKLTILGSGTSAMTKNRNPAGFVVESGGEIILLDAGFGVIRKLVDLGFDYQKIDLMGITHFHADHFGDAFNLIFARYVDDSYHQVLKPKGLNVMGPRGMEERLKKWREIYWPEESESYPVKFIEGESKLLVGEIMVETIKVIHVDHFESVAFRLTENGKTLVYTGDIGSRNRMDDLVKNFGQIDWLMTEASYSNRTDNHFTIEQVEEWQKLAEIKKIIVTHVNPLQEERVKNSCQEMGFIMAEDGMKVEI